MVSCCQTGLFRPADDVCTVSVARLLCSMMLHKSTRRCSVLTSRRWVFRSISERTCPRRTGSLWSRSRSFSTLRDRDRDRTPRNRSRNTTCVGPVVPRSLALRLIERRSAWVMDGEAVMRRLARAPLDGDHTDTRPLETHGCIAC
eukprot:53768-Rhodomonas_salina.3